MLFPSVNIFSVLLAAISNIVLGFIWYSPFFLGKPWMRLMGFTEKSIREKQKTMGPWYLLSFVGAIIQAAAISVVLKMTYTTGLGNSLLLAGLLWLGFIAVTQLTDTIFSGKKFSPHLLTINTSYQLVSVLAMTAILHTV